METIQFTLDLFLSVWAIVQVHINCEQIRPDVSSSTVVVAVVAVAVLMLVAMVVVAVVVVVVVVAAWILQSSPSHPVSQLQLPRPTLNRGNTQRP